MRILLALIVSSIFATSVVGQDPDELELEEAMRIAQQQARCINAIYGTFESIEDEDEAYRKFYSSLVELHTRYVDFALESDSGLDKVYEAVGSKDILVGMVLQGAMITAAEYNTRFKDQRTGKTQEEYSRLVWSSNGCDAIYSRM